MGQRVKPEELREMLKVARKLRTSASEAMDAGYTEMFVRAAEALEDRAAQLAFDPADLELPDGFEQDDEPPAYQHVDLLC